MESMSHSRYTKAYKKAMRGLRDRSGADAVEVVERYVGHLRRERSGLLDRVADLGAELARIRPLSDLPGRVLHMESEIDRLRRVEREAAELRRRVAMQKEDIQSLEGKAIRSG